MSSKHGRLRAMLTNAIVELCRKEAFYCEELRIEGTFCLVSDRSSVLIAQIAEQVGDNLTSDLDNLPSLNREQAAEALATTTKLHAQSESILGNAKESIKRKRTGNARGSRYPCPFCKKAYGLRHQLKEHLNKHTGRKPHLCRECGMCFSHLPRLAMHIRSEHKSKMKLSGGEGSQGLMPLLGMAALQQQQQQVWAEQAQAMIKMNKASKAAMMKLNAVTANNSHEDSYVEEDVSMSNDVAENGGVHLDMKEDIKVKQEVMEEDQLVENARSDQKKDGEEAEGVANIMQNFIKMLEGQKTEIQEHYNSGLGMKEETLSSSSAPHTPPAASGSLMHEPPAMPSMMPPAMPPWGMGFPFFPGPGLPTMVPTQNSRHENTMTGAHSMPRKLNPDFDFRRTPAGKFQCPFCEKTYSFKHTLKDHINKHTGLRPHVCKYCGDSFTHLASLCAHIKRRHDNVMPSDYQCEICQDKFMNLQSLKQHFTWRHKDTKFVPPMLSLLDNTETQGSLDDSMDENSLDISVKSNHGNSVSQGSSVTTSSSYQDSGKATSNYSGDSSGNLNRSEDDVKGQSDNSTGLDDDNIPSSVSEYFSEINHRTEHGVYKYQCKLCGNMFKIRGSIYEHINSHLGKKPFVCTICGDAFAHHSTLHNHTRNKHSNQSPAERQALLKHACPSCKKKFRFRSELERHYRTNPEHNTEPMGMLPMDFSSDYREGDMPQPVFPGNDLDTGAPQPVFPGQSEALN